MTLIAGILFAIFWCYNFVFLMMLEDNQFPGKHDKIIWATVFLILFPIAPFAFYFWKKATKETSG